jgi:hypothetical protein
VKHLFLRKSVRLTGGDDAIIDEFVYLGVAKT